MENELPPERGPEPVLEAPATAPTVISPPLPSAPSYPDRRTGLVIFGVIQIVLGLLAALMVPLAALGAFMSRLAPGGSAIGARQYISSIAAYAFAAGVFLCLGIGSVQMRRWAQALTLVISWYWMLTGILVTVLMTAVLPVTVRSFLRAQPNESGSSAPMAAGIMAVVLTVIIVFAAFFLIIVPIAFVIFYSRKDVAETCRHRDPVQRWTDHAPLPVLGASVVLSAQALYLLLTGATTPLFPFFGRYLYGIAGFACFFVVAGLDAYLAIALFRLKTAGWWIAAITGPIRLLSMALTYARADLMQVYSKMGWSAEQLRVLNSSPLFHSNILLWWSMLSAVILYGYILWLKKYFKNPIAQSEPAAFPVEAG